MPAPFTVGLCGYRDGRPNTSDAGDKGSIALGHLLFERLAVPRDCPPPDQKVDAVMTSEMLRDLRQHVAANIHIDGNRHLSDFEQFDHLSALRNLSEDTGSARVARTLGQLRRFATARIVSPPRDVTQLESLLDAHQREIQAVTDQRQQLIEQIGEESLLRLDVVSYRDEMTTRPHLLTGFSLKWSLRTDRAQDCRSQGAKMSALRRGRMPHFAAVTMEPRPAMLALLGRGSGDLDCVYHLDLPALGDAVEAHYMANRPPRQRLFDTFRRLVDQRRLRDYDELVTAVGSS